ncbi:MAG TPA: hypothetical protein VGB59_07875 [Allosphingosinicella sp.]
MSDRDDIIAHYAAGTLPQLFVERLRRHRTDELGKAFRATLTCLHNADTIDVLEPARQIASSPIDQHEFFTVMHVYTELIPTLEAETPAMLAAVKALVARAGDDMTSGMPNGAYRTWAEQGKRARATLAAIDPDDPEDSAYVFLGLQALAKSEPDAALDEAIAYLGGTSAPARSAAAKAIGTFALSTSEGRQQAAEALSAAAPAADDNSLGHILTAMCEIARAHPDMSADAATLIIASAPQAGDQAIHQLSLEFMFHGEELPAEIVAGLTAIMHKVRIANQGTLEHIDAAGGKLVTHKRLDEALALITPLISAHDELTSLETLDAFSYALLQLPPDQLAQVVIGWLLSPDPNLGRATMSLVGAHHGDKSLILQLDGATLDLPDADRILLAHRTIGWLFIHPITAASLVVGLLDGAGDAAAKVIADILFDPLLINFSGGLGDWLAERANDGSDPVQPVLTDLLARLEAYIEGLRRTGRIKEFRPSERERLIENHRQHESMRQAHKQAEKKSIFMSIVSRQVLLYGTRSISYFEGPDGKKQRNEMKMHSFSHSIESPRLNILEPFDLDYTLRVFRAMRKAAP